MIDKAIRDETHPVLNLTGEFFAQRAACLLVAFLLTLVSIASYFQSSVIKEMWPWEGEAMTYRFAAAYLFAFAGSLLWIAISREMAGLKGISLTVIVNAFGMSVFLAIYSVRHQTTELIPNLVGMIAILGCGLYSIGWSSKIAPIQTNPTPKTVRDSMVVFPLILMIASIRLILQSSNVFPWDPQPQWSTIIGLCLMGSVFYFGFGAIDGRWVHAGGQFAGFLAYDLVLIPPYLRMLNADDGVVTASASGFTSYASNVNDGPLYIFLTAIGISLVMSVWYLFLDRRTRMFAR